MEYSTIPCPHPFYPNNPERTVMRFQGSQDNVVIASIDYFIEGETTVLLQMSSHHESFDRQQALDLIRQMISACVHTRNIAAYNMNDSVRTLWDELVLEYPDKNHFDVAVFTQPRIVRAVN